MKTFAAQLSFAPLAAAALCLSACAGRPPPSGTAAASDAVETVCGPPRIEIRSWHQGQPPVRLIRKDAGFCALSLVTGAFAGGGEIVKVWIGPDGFWYLGGQSGQEGVGAECIVVHYR